jgi:oxalate decarboxylase
VLAQNFGWIEEQMKNLPNYNKYIFQGQVPPPLDQDRGVSPTGDVPRTLTHRMLKQAPQRFPGGSVQIADSTNFAASDTICAALVEINPGGMRKLHWHPTIDEWQYYLAGAGRMGVFANSGVARTFDYQGGDVGYVPFAYGHYIQSTGDEPLVFLEMFRASKFEDVSMMQWAANIPSYIMADTLNMPRELIEALPKDKHPVLRLRSSSASAISTRAPVPRGVATADLSASTLPSTRPAACSTTPCHRRIGVRVATVRSAVAI